jgi:hypothetical protein
LNQISDFQQPKNPSLFLFPIFFFCFGLPVFLLISFYQSHTPSHIFFTIPVSSSVQLHIRATDPICFGHLRPPDASRRLQPPRPPRRSSLCHPLSTPWSCLTSPSSPLKMVVPITSPSLFVHRRCLRPLTARLLPPYGPIKGVTRAPPLSIVPTGSNLSSSRSKPSPHQSTTGHLC